jgi:carbohydrate kinase (thermoresistant glucokinase family)
LHSLEHVNNTRVVVMGVAGTGKSAVGPAVAERLGVPFVDGDDAHTTAAKAQMAAGVPLTEEQRVPWLDTLHDVVAQHIAGVVLACSALTIASRRRLAGDLDVRFVALLVPEDVLTTRLTTRRGHFAGTDLLASQLATLELDESVVHVDGNRPIGEVVDDVVRAAASGAPPAQP